MSCTVKLALKPAVKSYGAKWQITDGFARHMADARSIVEPDGMPYNSYSGTTNCRRTGPALFGPNITTSRNATPQGTTQLPS